MFSVIPETFSSRPRVYKNSRTRSPNCCRLFNDLNVCLGKYVQGCTGVLLDIVMIELDLPISQSCEAISIGEYIASITAWRRMRLHCFVYIPLARDINMDCSKYTCLSIAFVRRYGNLWEFFSSEKASGNVDFCGITSPIIFFTRTSPSTLFFFRSTGAL